MFLNKSITYLLTYLLRRGERIEGRIKQWSDEDIEEGRENGE